MQDILKSLSGCMNCYLMVLVLSMRKLYKCVRYIEHAFNWISGRSGETDLIECSCVVHVKLTLGRTGLLYQLTEAFRHRGVDGYKKIPYISFVLQMTAGVLRGWQSEKGQIVQIFL